VRKRAEEGQGLRRERADEGRTDKKNG